MEIVKDKIELSRYISEAVKVSPDHPILLDQYLSNAIEIDVDALGLFYSTLKVVLVPVVFGIFLNAKLPRYTQNIQFYSPSVAVILITLIVV